MFRWKTHSKIRRQFLSEQLECRTLLAADLVISEFMAVNDGGILDGDQNASDWIELQNRGDADADLTGWFLTDNAADLSKYSLPNRTLEPSQFLIVFASAPSDGEGGVADDFVDQAENPHANFKLAGSGEFLALVQPDGVIAHSFDTQYPGQSSGVSYGIDEVGASGYFLQPTPGATNGPFADGFVADTKFDFDRGFYDEPFDLRITSETPGATIIYTTDGSAPSLMNGTPFVSTIRVDTTTTIRAAAVKDGFISSNVDTHTYIFLNDVIRQPATRDDLPTRWDGLAQSPIRSDYEMDPEIVDDPSYHDDLLQGLRELPTMSIVLNPEHMFGEEQGIYIHSAQRGRDWEHPTSVEIIEPDGSSFQTDSGIRIHGYSWRNHGNTPKHSFRLEFRDEYGPAKMEYPLFPDAPVDRFDSIVLRAQGGRAWAGLQNPAEAQYQRDTFARDLSRELGRYDGHATYVHLYINGLYWGLYNPVERPDAQMGAEYFGGTPDDYDALNRRTSTVEVIDGDQRRYRDMLRIVNAALRAGETTDEDYAQLQRDVAIDEFIDFMIVNQYVTNRDGVTAFEGNNQRAIGSRVGDAQFRFFVWDMEYSMWNATDNNNVDRNRPALAGSNNPSNGTWAIYKALRQHPDFRLRYADRVQKHFFNDGALTPENAAATWMERADTIENAIVAESARWGDAKRRRPYTRDVEWRREQERLLETYFPRRSEILIGHLQEVGLYPTTDVPSFEVNRQKRHGGPVTIGDTISLVQTGEQNRLTNILVASDAEVAVHVPLSNDLNTSWLQSDFSEGAGGEAWIRGENGVGFDNTNDYGARIRIDTRDAMRSNATMYVRIPFHIDDAAMLAAIDALQLNVLADDGFIAYVNGHPVASMLAPENPTWNSLATAAAEADLRNPIPFDVSSAVEHLVVGDNVLALHAMNFGTSSGDMLMHATLLAEGSSSDQIWYTTDESDPRLPNGTAKRYVDGIPVNASIRIRARARSFDGEWSALNEATFVADTPVAITEINYNPPPPTRRELDSIPTLDNNDFEFVEVMNAGVSPMNLVGASFSSGIEFTFGESKMEPGERAVVVRNAAAFSIRYGNDAKILGEYSGKLANDGERLSLRLADQRDDWLSIEYGDNALWPRAADGVGASLEFVGDARNRDSADKYYSWQASSDAYGTPGNVNSSAARVVINEVLSSGGDGMLDAIELFNTSGRTIDIGGWYLSDSANDLLKFQLPVGTSIPGNGYLVIDESSFNPTPANPTDSHFALSANGERVWLVTADAEGNVSGFVDEAAFGSSRTGESFARIPNGRGRLFPTGNLSLGERNEEYRAPTAVISEIHFNPGEPSAAARSVDPLIRAADLEFIELFNNSDGAVPISEFRIRGGVDGDFVGDVKLDSRSVSIVTSFDSDRPDNAKRLTAFRLHHGIGEEVAIVGQFSGRLSNNYDRITLQRHVDGLDTIEDEVVYGSESPWPVAAAGHSIHRRRAEDFGNAASSWRADEATPGAIEFDDSLFGDFNNDAQVNADDIDILCRNLDRDDLRFDLNGDDLVSFADHEYLIRQILGVTAGDANLDGVFNSTDLVITFQQAQYEDDRVANSGWSSGDWNCDSEFTTRDLISAFQFASFVSSSRPSLQALNRLAVAAIDSQSDNDKQTKI